MKLLHLLPWLRPCRPTRAAHRRADDGLPALDTPEEDERPCGCGWFDSSHDLQHGLSVREHATPDTLARELPLTNWIELQLAGWRASASAPALNGFTAAT